MSVTQYQLFKSAEQKLGHDQLSIATFPSGEITVIDSTLPPDEALSQEILQQIFEFAETLPEFPPSPPTQKIHAAWIKAYLSEQGWREELETIITNSGPIAQALWESGTTFNVSDKLVNDLWALHSQSVNHSVQDVFDAVNALRKSQTET